MNVRTFFLNHFTCFFHILSLQFWPTTRESIPKFRTASSYRLEDLPTLYFGSNKKDMRSWEIYYFPNYALLLLVFVSSCLISCIPFHRCYLCFISLMVPQVGTTISLSVIFACHVNHIFHEEQQGYYLRSGCSQ